MGEIERRSCQQEPKEQEINTLIKDIHQLYHFAKLNYCGFLSLFMQYHRLFGSGPPSDSLRRLIINKPFWDHSSDLFALIVRLSNLCINYYPLQPMDYKQKRLDSSSSSTTTVRSSETASSHEKTIKKYWVHPDNIVELMLFLSSNKMIIQDHQNNPSSTFMSADEVGHPQGIKSKSAESIHHVKNKIKKEIYSGRVKLTTVYMDSPDLGDYTERLVGQVDTLSCIKTTRIRWYDNVPCLSVEQKIYYNQQQIRHKGLGKEPEHQCCDALTTLSWVQQRIWFKHKHIQSWLNGNYSVSNLLAKTSCQYRADGAPTLIAENRQRMKQTCLQIQDEIHNKIKIPSKYKTYYLYIFGG
jgi:SPX domain protein involved in polyphosphate accumulation